METTGLASWQPSLFGADEPAPCLPARRRRLLLRLPLVIRPGLSASTRRASRGAAGGLLASLALLASACAGSSGGPGAAGAGNAPAHRAAGPGAAASSASTASPPAAGPAVSAPASTRSSPSPPPAPARPFVSPIRPDNRPNPVAGDTNGEMPATDLVGVAPDCRAARAAAPSLGLLMATAREEGVALGTEQCYRPLSDQVAVSQSWTARGNSACAAPVAATPSGKPKGTSMHGWGEAADFSDSRGGLTVGSPGDRFLEASANRFGWNHPGWARPGGSACPEAWHWEWVGDGGALHDSPVRADVVALLPAPGGRGYATVTGLGALTARGQGALPPAPPVSPLGALITGGAATGDGRGCWLVASDGGVFTFGDARYLGSAGGHPVGSDPVVGLAPSAGGDGYWLVTAGGRVTAFGAAGSYGSPARSGVDLARPVVGIAPSSSGRGYWLVTADGGVFAYGDAGFYGSAAGRRLPAPVVAMARTPDGRGYWLAGADGSVYPFGDASPAGSPAGSRLFEPVVGMAATPSGRGYWLVAADGGIFSYGDARFFGPG